MTSFSWLTSQDPSEMLELLRGKASVRKLRLFACACASSLWKELPPEALRMIEVAELFADGQASLGQLFAVREAAAVLAAGVEGGPFRDALSWTLTRTKDEGGWPVPQPPGTPSAAKARCGLLRDIFGNPWRPIIFAPAVLAWQQGTVVRMAEAIYEGRKWEDMPLLGDALEEAGCSDQAILDHCRRSGPHARGCHVVDAILGRC